MTHRLLALAALLALPIGASAQTAIFAEALGATGSYAVGVEQGVVTSADGARRLAVRVGASYWRERSAFTTPTGVTLSDLYALAVPVGAVASFALGEPAGFPLAADIGVGAVFIRRTGGYTEFNNNKLALPVYGDVGLRASLGRASLRAGILAGGNPTSEFFESNSVRPVASVGVRL